MIRATNMDIPEITDIPRLHRISSVRNAQILRRRSAFFTHAAGAPAKSSMRCGWRTRDIVGMQFLFLLRFRRYLLSPAMGYSVPIIWGAAHQKLRPPPPLSHITPEVSSRPIFNFRAVSDVGGIRNSRIQVPELVDSSEYRLPKPRIPELESPPAPQIPHAVGYMGSRFSGRPGFPANIARRFQLAPEFGRPGIGFKIKRWRALIPTRYIPVFPPVRRTMAVLLAQFPSSMSTTGA